MRILEQKGYIYKEHISTGGQGEVHLIERDGRPYIAKIFSLMDDDALQLINHIKEIDAPNVPEIHEVYNENDKTVLIREYIKGHTLYEEIQESNALSLDRASYIILKICETLKTFHDLKPNPIIYRDLKPENIMISDDDEVYLIDFGIARYHKNLSTRDTVLAGTKGYTAPEVMAGMQSDNRSDIYSVGLIFYEMLTGKNLLVPPYQIRPVKESDDTLPKWVDKVIKKTTDMNMVMRYRDISEVASIVDKANNRCNKSKKWMLYSAALLMIVSVLLLGINAFVNQNKDNADSKGNEVYDGMYETVFEIEFDDLQDLSMLELVGEKVENGEINEEVVPSLLNDGVYLLRCQTIINEKLRQGSFVHLRILPEMMEQDGELLFISIIPDDSDGAYNIPFVNREIIGSEIINEYGFYYQEPSGFPVVVENKWIDVIIYLDDSGETLRYFVSDIGDENSISYGGIHVFDEWIGREYNIEINIPFEYWERELGIESPVSHMEFVKYGSGSITGYLIENLPSYSSNRDEVDDFISREIEFIPLEEFNEHGH